MSRWVVVLAGGVGSRFWPLSTPTRPKQLLPLISGTSLLQDTLDRLRPLADADHTLVLTNAGLVEPITSLLPELPLDNIVAEPRPAGTAAALTWAAREIERRDPGGTMLSVHADWAIGDPARFRDALSQAASAAERHHALVTVGVVPSRPDPGFGYIQPGEPVSGELRHVQRFAEKPDRETAARMVVEGFLWNSGIFVWRVSDFLDEVRALTPEVAPALIAHGDDIAAFFAAVQSVPVDVGVMERSRRVMVLPGDFGWDDIGTWEALARVRPLDASGNATHGSVFAVDASGNVVHAEEGDVVLYGVSDLVVVTCRGMTLVTTTARAADLKQLIDRLPRNVRDRA